MEEIYQTSITLATLCITSPIQTIKTRLQTCQELVMTKKLSFPYANATDCVKTILKTEGLLSFFRGNTISLLRFYPNELINFEGKALIQRHTPNTVAMNALAGVLGGWCALLLLYPLDVLRLRTSLNCPAFKGISSAHTLYKGLSNSLATCALFRGTYNGLYDSVKEGSEAKRWGYAYASCLVANALCYPIDAIRKKKIALSCANDSHTYSFAYKAYNANGRALYRGFTLQCLQTIISATILYSFDRKQRM